MDVARAFYSLTIVAYAISTLASILRMFIIYILYRRRTQVYRPNLPLMFEFHSQFLVLAITETFVFISVNLAFSILAVYERGIWAEYLLDFLVLSSMIAQVRTLQRI